MQALVCDDYQQPPRVVEIQSPTPGPGQVLIQVKAAGINFPDSLFIQGKYQVKPAPPAIPGFELAGIVLAVGAGVEGFRPGQRVAAHPMEGGAFAEQAVVAAGRVFALPDAVDFVTAAGFLISYGTSQHALKDRGHLRSGETLLVLGAAGGIGLTAVELGKVMGARVIACASSPAKLALCKQYGADALIDYTRENWRDEVKALTRGRGVDVVYDPVGGLYTESALRCLAQEGRYLVLGFAAGSIPKVALNHVLLKLIAIIGAYWGPAIDADPARNARNLEELFQWYAQGKLKPHISEVYPLAQAATAINRVAERLTQGKVVLDMDAIAPR